MSKYSNRRFTGHIDFEEFKIKKIKELYFLEHMSQKNIANKLKVSLTKIHNVLINEEGFYEEKEYQIEENKKIKKFKNEVLSLYYNEDLEISDISEKMNISENEILNIIDEKEQKEKTKKQREREQLILKDRVCELFFEKHFERNDIKQILGISSAAINKIIRENESYYNEETEDEEQIIIPETFVASDGHEYKLIKQLNSNLFLYENIKYKWKECFTLFDLGQVKENKFLIRRSKKH